MPGPAGRVYCFEGVAVEVAAGDAATAEWLDEALAPWVAAPVAAGGHRIELLRAQDPLRALGLAAGRPAEATRACFALDSRVLAYPAWPQGANVVLEDARYASFLEVGRTRTRVVGSPQAVAPRIPLMRAVREVAAAAQHGAPDRLELHAAAFAVGERTLLVSGPKQAGKTTLLLHVLATGKARLVGNDRASVRWEASGSRASASGVPTFVRIRPSTLAMFPELARGLPARVPPYYYSLRELGEPARLAQAPSGDGHLVLTTAQLCRQTGVTACSGGSLAAVLLPEHASDTREWSLERLDPAAASRMLLAHRYGADPRLRPRTVFEELVGGDARSEVVERELAARLAAQVPVYRCRMGHTSAPDPASAGRLLDALSL